MMFTCMYQSEPHNAEWLVHTYDLGLSSKMELDLSYHLIAISVHPPDRLFQLFVKTKEEALHEFRRLTGHEVIYDRFCNHYIMSEHVWVEAED